MSIFDPIPNPAPTSIGAVRLAVTSTPEEEGGLEYAGRVAFEVLDQNGNVLARRRAPLQADALTVEQRQALVQLLTSLRNQAEGALP